MMPVSPNRRSVALVRLCAVAALCLLACGLGGVTFSSPAHAIADYGPDAAEFPDNRYVLANSVNTGDQSSMQIPIYYTGRTKPSMASLRLQDVQRYEAQDQAIIVNGNYSNRYAADSVINIGGFTWDSTTGTWRSLVSFQMVNGTGNSPSSYYRNRIAFRLAVDADYLVGNAAGGSSGWFNIIAADPSAGLPALNYSVQFATPCTVTTNTVQTIRLYDLDSSNLDNESKYISISVNDQTAGGIPVALSTSGSMTAQNGTYELTMTFQPNHKYVLHINNVSHINLIQYKFPYDNANYATGCPQPAKYDLTPSVSTTPSVAEAGANITATPEVANSGPNDSSDTAWTLAKIIVVSGASLPNGAGGTSGTDACGGYFSGIGVTCLVVANGTSSFHVDGTVTGAALSSYSTALDDVPVGSRVCFALSVNPHGSDSTSEPWRHSALSCILVSKKPKVQVHGGDLYVGQGSSIATSTTRKQTGLYGSWGEYLITAGGSITGMASARGYTDAASKPFCAVSYLTLTQTTAGVCADGVQKGGYAGLTNGSSATSLLNTLNGATSLGNDPTVDVATQTGGVYSATGTVTLKASGQVTGRSFVLNAPEANVVIDGNLEYANGPYTSVLQVPQVVIIANTIKIKANAAQVDAWLLAIGADGTLNTCSDVTAATDLDSTKCATLLRVNGPVVAKHLLLYRTAGSGTGVSSGDPAEIFNLRPDAYLWLSNWQRQTPKAQTVTTVELPPRY